MRKLLTSPYFINVFLVLISTLFISILLYLNRYNLLTGYDGSYMKQLIAESLQQSYDLFSLNSSSLQAFGDISYPVQFSLSLPALASHLSGIENSGGLVIYYLITFWIVAISIYFLSRQIGLDRNLGIFSSLLFPILVLPLLPSGALYPVSTIGPWLIEQAAFSTLAFFLILHNISGRISNKRICFNLFFLAIICYYLATYLPVTAILTYTWLSCAFITSILTPYTRKWIKSTSTALTTVGISIFMLVTILPFLLGLVLQTVPTFFSYELIANRPKLEFISIFYYGFLGQGWLNSIFYILGVSSAIFFLRYDHIPLRFAALSVLIYSGLLQFLGLLILFYFDEYTGAWPLYFEWHIWPVFFVLVIALLEKFSRRCFASVIKQFPNAALKPLFTQSTMLTFLLLSVLSICAYLSWHYTPNMPAPFPPRETQLVSFLKEKIGVYQGQPWRGSYLNITGARREEKNKTINWNDQNGLDARSLYTHGNGHRTWGMWSHGIPTIFSYNQLMSPFYYAFATSAFSVDEDQQQRSVLVLTQPNIQALSLIGGKYILSDYLLESDLLKLAFQFPTAPSEKFKLQHVFTESFKNFLLYEVKESNLGSFSPTQPILSTSAKETLEIILDQGFDPSIEIIVHQPIEGTFEAADEVTFAFKNNQARVVVKSDAQSIINLPITFSNCLKVEHIIGKAKIIRANLFQTALISHGNSETSFAYRNGPLLNSSCRLDDWDDARNLNLSEVKR